jgi:uncharacterized protein YegP (UPF0339 family)
MPIKIWKSKGGTWYWTAFAKNGATVADSAEGYVSKAGAVDGLEATAREMVKWHAAQQKQKARKKATSAHLKPAGKRSTLSNSQTRRTAKRGD